MKKVLITGANKSIGFETARQLLQKGYYVYLGSRDRNRGEEAVNKLKAEGLDNVETVEIDVSNPASVQSAYQSIASKTDQLDALINNAGILGGMEQSAQTASLEMFHEVFETNFFGAINVTQTFLELLKKADQPRIVNVTSGLGSITLHNDPSWRYYQVKTAAYGPSKSALNAYTTVLAYELRDTKFKVNVVDPGYTATDFNHHSGHRSVADAAADIVKFATLDADGPNGQFYSIENNPETGVSAW
ncbi:SDR family oxidoreductase [Mucilaginibacter sp. KACC 22063]|uniref:SDR family oxidoreductase n=1 Tax=Mucilaginibacter sp. KACC 22063 TaxID=3025666 RepID=UPI0023662606|nr:SDR family oxidoreductase [Mucilaginibacter sp. KACC 22063]WDF54140.1 SDR family oxidoreductase [Mucilaginibacter sp. KACC 22063]